MMKCLSAIIVMMFLLHSCAQTYYVSIDIRKAAPLDLGADTKKIIIADNSFVSNGADSIYQLNNQASLTKDLIDSVRPIFMRSFTKYTNEENLYDTVELYPYYPKPLYLYKEAAGRTELPLTKDEVVEICQRTKADALMSLDFIGVTLQLEPYSKYFGQMKTKIGAKVRVYKNNGDTIGNPIIEIDSLSKAIGLFDKASISRDLKLNIINNIEWVADMLVNSFIPKWEFQERIYYRWYPNSAYEARAVVNRGHWAAAAPIWEEEYEKEKSWKKKAKCASNAALSYEFTDDIEKALKWINTAYDLLPSNNKSNLAKQIKDYKKVLEERAKEAPLLKKQLRIDENTAEFTDDNT